MAPLYFPLYLSKEPACDPPARTPSILKYAKLLPLSQTLRGSDS